MKVLEVIETASLKLYVALTNAVLFQKERFQANRGQASLEYIAIAAGIVVVAAVAFLAFRTPIEQCGGNILARVFGNTLPHPTGPCK